MSYRYHDIITGTLKQGDEVVFNVFGETLTYVVLPHYLLNASSGGNDRIFELLKLDKEVFCDKHYGYKPGGGDWPISTKDDFEALTRVVNALYDVINSRDTKTTKTIMSNIIEKFRELTSTPEERLLKTHGIEDPIGTPTKQGLDLALELLYTEKRDEIIEIVKKLDKSEKSEK